MKKTTACISPDGLVNIANAFAFSEQQGTPFTAFVTVAWSKTAGWTDDLLPERQGQLFWNLARWLRKRGVPTAYVWTLETVSHSKTRTSARRAPTRLASRSSA